MNDETAFVSTRFSSDGEMRHIGIGLPKATVLSSQEGASTAQAVFGKTGGI